MDKKSVAHLQNLDARLSKLLNELKNYSNQKLNEQPDSTSWSVLQIMQHLMLAESGSVKYIQQKIEKEQPLKSAGLGAAIRGSMVNLALFSPFKIEAPRQVSGEKLATNLTFWEVAKEWKKQRAKWKSFLEQLPEDIYTKEIFKHHKVGMMKISDMLSIFNTHMDRHTRQIKRTLKQIEAVKQV